MKEHATVSNLRDLFGRLFICLNLVLLMVSGAQSQSFDPAGYSIFGGGIGDAGIVIVNGDLVVPGGANFGGFFQVLRYDKLLRRYRPIFISENFGSLIEGVRTAQLDADSPKELVVALSDGRVVTYDTSPWSVSNRIQHDIQLSALAVGDLNGDGIDDIVTSGLTRVRGIKPDGTQLWSFLHSAGILLSLAVGQLDGDPAAEVVLGDGRILDSTTLQVQTSIPGVFQLLRFIELANLDSDSALEILSTDSSNVFAYDPGSSQQLWSFLYPGSRLVRVTDTDLNGSLELVVTSSNSPDIDIFDLNTQQLLRRFSFIECGGVGGFAFGDLNRDKRPDLYIGVGYSCSAEDSFYVINALTGRKLWRSEQRDGPLAPVVSGDIDGNGSIEVVTASGTTVGGYSSGKVVILNQNSLLPQFISPPLVGDRSYEAVEQVQLANISGDARPEILVGADDLYNGVVEGYSYGPGNNWNLVWRNTITPPGVSFASFQVADVDADNIPDLVVGERKVSSTSTGPFIRAYDIGTRLEKWRSAPFYGTSAYPSLRSISVGNLDLDPAPEVAAIWSAYNFLPQVIVVDGQTGQTEWIRNGNYTSAKIANQILVLGTESGDLEAFQRSAGGTYTSFFQQNFGVGAIRGMGFDFGGGLLTLSIGGRLQLHDGVTPTPLFTSPPLGLLGGSTNILTALPSGRPAILTSGNHAVHAITGP